jgi:hypothetical protein
MSVWNSADSDILEVLYSFNTTSAKSQYKAFLLDVQWLHLAIILAPSLRRNEEDVVLSLTRNEMISSA